MASQSPFTAVAGHIASLQQQFGQCSITNQGGLDEESRKQMLAEARKLVASLEQPVEVVMRHVMEDGAQRMSIRVAAQLRLFQYLTQHESRSVTAAELAENSKAEKLLIQRIMRVITAMGFATETGVRCYRANAVTKAAATPPLHGTIVVWHDGPATTQMQMHKYFLSHGYKCPTNEKNCGFQFALGTQQSYFDWIHNNSELLVGFNTAMKGLRGTRSHWLDWFPVEFELLTDFIGEEGEVLLVDVGGGRGQDIERLLVKFPRTEGHLVLQDLPVAVSNLPDLSEGIARIAHDFFTPQPLKGARAYYLHQVFHYWPDEACRKILRNLKTAMKPGYSKLLINDAVLPDRDCPSFAAAADLNMMSISGAMERTKRQWIDLIESVDLRVVRIWESPYKSDVDGIIEAMSKW